MTPRLPLIALLLTFTPPVLAALTLDPASPSFLLQDGEPLSRTPPRILLTEWIPTGASAGGESGGASQAQGVGSIIEAETLDARVLSWREDPWLTQPTVTSDGAPLHYHAVFPRDLVVDYEWQQHGDHLRVTGALRNLANDPARREVPVTLGLALFVEDANLEWLRDHHVSESAASNDERIWSVTTTAGPLGAMSRYLHGAVRGDRVALAAAFPPDQPRIQRIRWDGVHRALVIEFDAVVSDETLKFPNEVPFEFWVFDFPREFGARGVLRSYYDLAPDSFAARSMDQGQWMPFTQIDHVQRPEDFHFRYHEYHPNVSVAYNNANDIESLVYCEPPVQYVILPQDAFEDAARLQRIIDSKSDVQGSQVRGSAAYRSDGSLFANYVVTPWATGARIPTNGDPELPRTAGNPYNSFDANWKPYLDLYRNRAAAPPQSWTGGLSMDGVVGASGRALMLSAGGSTSQPIETKSGTESLSGSVRAKGREGAHLRVALSGLEGDVRDFALSASFAEYAFELPGGTVLPTLLLQASGADVWIDEVRLDGASLDNAGFESTTADPEQVTGLYLDSFEGWDSKDINFRREHFATSDFPLTFEATTGTTGQVIMMGNFELAAEARRRLHERGDLLMANTALYQWAWSAHYLDVLGIETNWGTGERLSPPDIGIMDYIRALCYQKPYCYLQNVEFDKFRGAKVDQYFARCLHYGFWPGFFSHNAAEAPYWENPDLYNSDRALFIRFMRPQAAATRAGWEPITLAAVDDDELLVERWGGAPYRGEILAPDTFFLTVYNPTDRLRQGSLTLDSRLTGGRRYLAIDALGGSRATTDSSGNVTLALAPLDVTLIQFVARDDAGTETTLAAAQQELLALAAKWQRHGMIDAEAVQQLARLQNTEALGDRLGIVTSWRTGHRSQLEPLYQFEFDRAFSTWRLLLAARDEAASGQLFDPQVPSLVTPGEDAILRVSEAFADRDLIASAEFAGTSSSYPLTDGVATIPIPASLPIGEKVRFSIQPRDALAPSPHFESHAEVRPALGLLAVPASLTAGDQVPLGFAVRNNLARPQAGTLRLVLPPECGAVAPMPLELSAGEERSILIPLSIEQRPADLDAVRTVRIEWHRRDSGDLITQSLPLTILARGASLLRGHGITAHVDSAYFGYDTRPLTDGVTDTRNVDWVDAAWASEEALVPHWVEFRFAEPLRISEVKIWWALDNGVYHTSAHLLIQGTRDGETWQTLVTHTDPTPSPVSTYALDATPLRGLRLLQPAGGGAPTRPGILWLGEVEAR